MSTLAVSSSCTSTSVGIRDRICSGPRSLTPSSSAPWLSPRFWSRETPYASRSRAFDDGVGLQHPVQQRGQCAERFEINEWLGLNAHVGHACRAIEHPGRNLERPRYIRAVQRATEDAIGPLGRAVNKNVAPEPGMKPIKKLSAHRPVGVLKPCCTTTTGPIAGETPAQYLAHRSAARPPSHAEPGQDVAARSRRCYADAPERRTQAQGPGP